MGTPGEIARILEPALAADPDAAAVVARSGSLSYAELDRLANRWARPLQEHGVSTGDRVSAAAVTEWVRRERVTVWNGPPPLLYSLAHDDRVAASDLGSLSEVWSGGADCPESIRGAFEGKFGVEVRGTYGLTEAPTVVAIEVPGTEHADGSSGTPLPHIELTVRDSEGAPLPAGQAGVFGVPDERLGERVGMLVQPKPGKAVDLGALLQHCRDRLAAYKVPELVATTDLLPRNAMNKIDRRELARIGREAVSGSGRIRPASSASEPPR